MDPTAIGGYRVIERREEGFLISAAADPTSRFLAWLAPERVARDANARGVYLARAEKARRAAHPNILPIRDVVEAPPALVTDVPNGVPLTVILRSGPFPAGRALAILIDVLRALAAAHGRGVVHGALAADSVLVASDGRATLADVGVRALARALDAALAAGGALPAPDSDPRSDVRQAALLLVEALGGPPGGAGQQEILEGSRLARLLFALPAKPRNAVWQALADRPEDRFPTATEFLRAIEAGEPSGRGATAPESTIELAEAAVLDESNAAHGRPAAEEAEELKVTVGAPVAAPARAVLRPEAGKERLFLVGRPGALIGRRKPRGPDDGNDIICRLLPCRDAERDPENWKNTLEISSTHVALQVHGEKALISDLSSRGTTLDGVKIPTRRAMTPRDDFVMNLADVLFLKGRIVRARDGKIEAVVLARLGNTPEHVYAIVPARLYLRVERNLLEPSEPGGEMVSLVAGDGAWRLVAGRGRVRVEIDGQPVKPGKEAPLVPGSRLRVGEASYTFGAATPTTYVTA